MTTTNMFLNFGGKWDSIFKLCNTDGIHLYFDALVVRELIIIIAYCVCWYIHSMPEIFWELIVAETSMI